MKRYALLVNLAVYAECDTLMEAVLKREDALEAIDCRHMYIVEVFPAIEAYAMAHREAEAEKIRAAYGKPR